MGMLSNLIYNSTVLGYHEETRNLSRASVSWASFFTNLLSRLRAAEAHITFTNFKTKSELQYWVKPILYCHHLFYLRATLSSRHPPAGASSQLYYCFTVALLLLYYCFINLSLAASPKNSISLTSTCCSQTGSHLGCGSQKEEKGALDLSETQNSTCLVDFFMCDPSFQMRLYSQRAATFALLLFSVSLLSLRVSPFGGTGEQMSRPTSLEDVGRLAFDIIHNDAGPGSCSDGPSKNECRQLELALARRI